MTNRIELSVVAPCFNERGNLRELAARVLAVFDQLALSGELVLIDDGSQDDSRMLLAELAREQPRVVVRCHARNRGIEAAWRSGVHASRGRYVCLIDADLQNRPEDIARLYRALREPPSGTEADPLPAMVPVMVQGQRVMAGGDALDPRRLLSRGLAAGLAALFGLGLRDAKSGFVLAERDALIDVLTHRYAYRHFQTYVAVAARARGLRVHAVETRFEPRRAGQSSLGRWPLRVVAGALIDTAKALVEYRVRPRPPDPVAACLAAQRPLRRDPPLPGARRLRFELFFLTFPLHKWMLTRRARTDLAQLKQSQWLAPDALRALQERRLRQLIARACADVPYYRALFARAGLRPDEIRTLDDLRRVPLLDKATVRAELERGLRSRSADPRALLRIATSGSTGEPFVLDVERAQLELRWASTMRALEWTGWRWGDPQARLWHQTIGMSRSQIVRERLDAWLLRRSFIPAFELRPDNLAAFLARLRRQRPVLLDGYAEVLNLLAYYAAEHGIDGVRPKAVMSSGQVLCDQVRAEIEQRFGAEVYDKYGSREFSGIAYECDAHQGHHVMAESYIVELLTDGRPARPGEIGEVVITDLSNHCVPLIRYRIGDLAVAMDERERCPCGRGLPRIGRIEGRTSSVLLCADGTWLPGSFFAHFFKDYHASIRHYQVAQREPGAFELRLVKGFAFSDTELERMLRALRGHVGGSPVEVVFVDAIPLGRTGKRPGEASSVALDFQALSAAQRSAVARRA
ncbi:MAG TPA: glycosyltransferase [Polyangiales bacterium]|nr:glycosyltransferase [Polyangiales bacterium]